jgi:hypothetical protein
LTPSGPQEGGGQLGGEGPIGALRERVLFWTIDWIDEAIARRAGELGRAGARATGDSQWPT